jgi:phosphopantetheinyl transferase
MQDVQGAPYELHSTAHAWQMHLSDLRAAGVCDRWLSRLPADERARYAQFQTEAARERYLAARVLCRATLSRYTGVDPSQWRFSQGPHGKPTLAHPDVYHSLRFNLSSAGDWVICIVTRAGEVGVDVEDISRPVDASLVARHFLSRRQAARLASLPPRERNQRFFEQWVLKEAYVKATGEGLVATPERFGVAQAEDGSPVPIRGCQFSLHRPDANSVAAGAVLPRRRGNAISIQWIVVADALED